MIVRNNTASSFLVEFPSGNPDGNITWRLYDENGVLLVTDTFTPAAADISAVITVDPEYNLLDGVLSGYRDLRWSYIVGSLTINGEVRYNIEAAAPWGASPSGVRNKLGIAPHELPDDEISLIRAYYNFATMVSPTNPILFAPTAEQRLRLADAVEAMAALNALPTLQIRLASKESSGTDTFHRQEVDYATLEARLLAIVSEGAVIIVPSFDVTAGFGAVFILAPPAADAITGA